MVRLEQRSDACTRRAREKLEEWREVLRADVLRRERGMAEVVVTRT